MLIKYNKNNQPQNITENNDVLYSNIKNVFVIRILKPVLNIHIDKKDFPQKQDKITIMMIDFFGNIYTITFFSYSERILMKVVSDGEQLQSPSLEIISIQNGVAYFKLIYPNNNNSVYIISPSQLTYTLTDT